MPQKTWANQFENIKKEYEHSEKPQHLNRRKRIEEDDD